MRSWDRVLRSMDPYRVLGVGPHASQRELKKAYRRLAFLHHPDRNPGDPEAEERFKEVASAYRVLSDRKRRAEHDARGGRAAATDAAGRRGDETTGRASGSGQARQAEREPWGEAFEVLRHDSWSGVIPVRFQDAVVGAVMSLSITLASQASRESREFLITLGAALGLGLVASWPVSYASHQFGERRLAAGPLRTFSMGVVCLALGVVGSLLGASTATGGRLTFGSAIGVPYAIGGGLGGGLLGASIGRIFGSVVSPAAGAVSGGLTGSVAGGLVAGFFWYWGAVLKYSAWPVRDDESIAAFVGVVGACLGSGIAAIYGGLRSSLEDPQP